MFIHIHSDGQKKHLLTSVLVGIVAIAMLLLGFLLVYRGHSLVEQQLRDRLRDAAAAGTLEINGDVLQQIRSPADANSPVFIDTVHRLRRLRDSITNVSSVYLMRKTNDPNTFSFIADGAMLDSKKELDDNHDGNVEANEAAPTIAQLYDVSKFPVLRNEAFLRPTVDTAFTTDQWGTVISGYAPVRTSSGKVVAVLGIDMNAQDFLGQTRDLGTEFLTFLVLLGGVYVVWVSIFLVLQWRMDVLRTLEEERTNLLLLASHQLGEPLTIFKFSVEALAEEKNSPSLSEVVGENLGNLQQGIARMESVLSLLSTATILEEGVLNVTLQNVELGEVLRGVAHDIGAVLQEKNQSVVFEVEENLVLEADAHFLRRAVHELFDNASAFSPNDSTITVAARKRGKQIILEIIDHGCGIPPGDFPRLFRKFERGSNAPTHRPNGYGLGLFVAKRLFGLIGGRVTLRSHLDEGTTAIVSLPTR